MELNQMIAQQLTRKRVQKSTRESRRVNESISREDREHIRDAVVELVDWVYGEYVGDPEAREILEYSFKNAVEGYYWEEVPTRRVEEAFSGSAVSHHLANQAREGKYKYLVQATGKDGRAILLGGSQDKNGASDICIKQAQEVFKSPFMNVKEKMDYLEGMVVSDVATGVEVSGEYEDVIDGLMSELQSKNRPRPTGRKVREAYRDDYVKVANSTSRSGGASAINKDGSIRSVTARYVMDHANKDDAILDFGAGKTAIQAQALKDKGFTNVTAYDFGSNSKEGLHDPKALSRTYDIVFASNVINVSSDEEMLRDTLKDMWKAVKSGGRCIFNYPASPRKAGFSAQEVQDIVEDELGKTPKIVVGPKSSPVYELVK